MTAPPPPSPPPLSEGLGPLLSYRVLFQSFFAQDISLLPKIVTEAHANLKKRKTSCNTTLKHYAVMVKYTPLERSSLSSLIC